MIELPFWTKHEPAQSEPMTATGTEMPMHPVVNEPIEPPMLEASETPALESHAEDGVQVGVPEIPETPSEPTPLEPTTLENKVEPVHAEKSGPLVTAGHQNLAQRVYTGFRDGTSIFNNLATGEDAKASMNVPPMKMGAESMMTEPDMGAKVEKVTMEPPTAETPVTAEKSEKVDTAALEEQIAAMQRQMTEGFAALQKMVDELKTQNKN